MIHAFFSYHLDKIELVQNDFSFIFMLLITQLKKRTLQSRNTGKRNSVLKQILNFHMKDDRTVHAYPFFLGNPVG